MGLQPLLVKTKVYDTSFLLNIQLNKASEKEADSKKKIIAIDKELKRLGDEKVCKSATARGREISELCIYPIIFTKKTCKDKTMFYLWSSPIGEIEVS